MSAAPREASQPGFTAAGLRKGDKVIFWGENRPEWIACYWGCLITGVVVVPIDYRSSAEFVAKVRRLVQGRIILIGDEVRATPPDVDVEGAERWLFADLDWRADGPMPEPGISRDDIIQVIFTSGANRGAQGCGHPAPQRACQHRPGGA